MTKNIISKIKSQPYSYIFSCLLIVLLTAIVFAQTIDFGLIAYDDNKYISANPHMQDGFTYSNFVWSVTYFLNYNWAPLTIWSYIADASIFGGWYGGYHLTNVVLHGANGLLLFFIAFKLSNKFSLSLLLSILFIVHPQHVESVAWVSQRKDLLSTLFLFLSLWFYICFKTKTVRYYYFISIGAFVLGLMAKVIIAPYPIVLILINYVFFSTAKEIRNFGFYKKIVIEIFPYFIAAFIVGGINFYAQLYTGALGYSSALPSDVVISGVPLAYWFYPIKTVAPYNLIPFYPYPTEAPILLSIFAFTLLVTVTIVLYLYRDKYKYLFFGWFLYLILATPMNAVFKTGGHLYADRYSYIANIGLLIILIVIINRIGKYISIKAVNSFVIVSVLMLTYLSYKQTALWENNYLLFSHTLSVSRDNMVAQLKFIGELLKKNEISAAEKYMARAIKSNPQEAAVYLASAKYYFENDNPEYAWQLLNSAIKANVRQKGHIYREMAQYFIVQGDYDSAIKYSTSAVNTKDNVATAYFVRASAYIMDNNYRDAIIDLQKAISINQQYTEAYILMGSALMDLGYEHNAILYYKESLKQNPSNTKLKNIVSQLTETYKEGRSTGKI